MGINLTKVLSVLSTENYRTMVRENKDPYKWGDKPYSWIRKLNMVKMSVLPKLTYRLRKKIPIRISPGLYFCCRMKLSS